MVDNGSADGSVAQVNKDYGWVKVIPLNKNLFFPRANNIAIKATKGEYILLLNNDTILDKDAIKEMVITIKKDPQTAAVTPKMKFFKNRQIFDAFGTLIMPDGSPFNRGIGQYDIGQYDIEENIFGACFGAVLIKRSVYEKIVGPLDNDYFGYFEDVDWCYRAQGMGFKIMTCPKATVFHDHSGTSKKLGQEWKYYLIHRNYLRTLFKNYGLKNICTYYIFKVLLIVKHGFFPPTAERRISCIKILIDTFIYFPKLLIKRLLVRSKRIDKITDEMIWSFSVGEKSFFNSEIYEPNYSIENLQHSYIQKHARIENLDIDQASKNQIKKTLIKLNDIVINSKIYNKKEIMNRLDDIEIELAKDIGESSAKDYISRLKHID